MRNQTSKLKFLSVTVLVLSLLTVTAFAALLFASNLAYAQSTVDFDFDTGSPPPSLYRSTPFNYSTSSGVTGHFSSPMEDPLHPAYSVQNDGTTGLKLSTFSGNYLWPSGATRSPLEMKFSQPLTNITFSFATWEFHTGHLSFVNLTAYVDSIATTPIGTASAQGTWPGEGTPAGDTFPQGILTFNSSNPFNLVLIELPYQGAFSASSFLVDSIRVTTADPALDAAPPVTTASLSGTAGNQGWYTSNVVVSLSAVDSWSGVSKTEYSFDNANWILYQTLFTIATEGTTTVYYNSTDNAGNVEATKSQIVKIDKSVPSTTISLGGTAGNNGWYKSTVTVTLTASDSVSGVSSTAYSFDNVAWTPYTTPFIVSTQGTSSIYYKSTDVAGNAEAAKTQTVKIDTGSPVTMISLSGNPGDITVTLSASDSVSGVAKTEYSFDNVAWTVYTAPFKVTNTQTTTVYYKSTDVAGNAETVKSKDISGDVTPPSTSITLSGVAGNLDWYKSNVDVSLSATDDWSGVAKTEYSLDNATWTTYTTSFAITIEGTTTVYYRSTDNMGNIEAVKTQTIKIDKTSPQTSISFSGVMGTGGWYTSTVTVTLTTSDSVSGVAETEYSFDNLVWTVYSSPFTVTNEGTNLVYYRSIDTAGNAETAQTQTVKIDKVNPTGSIVINNGDASVTSTSVTLTLTSNDGTSGVSEVRYSNDGVWDTEPWEPFSANKAWTLIAGDGAKTVYYQTKDNAGLVSATYQDSIMLEATQPPVDVTKPVANAGPDKAVTEDTTMTLDGSASTDNVAITSYTWKFVDVTTKTLTGAKPTYTFATPGVFTVTLNVTDAAGNWAIDTVNIEVIDTTDPIADAGQDRTVNVNEFITFDASASSDNVGIVLYEWDCGDGTIHTEKTITHTYDVPGNYTVTLTVVDAAGNMANHSIIVTVLPAQALPIQASQLWIILGILAIGIGATAALLLKRRK